MCETLLLANSYTHTLRPVRSRASTLAKKTRTASRVFVARAVHGLAAWSALFFWVRPPPSRGLVSGWVGGMVRHAYKLLGGCPRIARGEPWAGSVTGGEACGYPCSEKEGFTHSWLWRAPCFWGTYE